MTSSYLGKQHISCLLKPFSHFHNRVWARKTCFMASAEELDLIWPHNSVARPKVDLITSLEVVNNDP
jgi:hypothetical protein